MTGTQPRPLRYRGRTNRRGRKAGKMWLRWYGEDMDRRWNEAEDMGSTYRGLLDEPLESRAFGVVMPARGWGKTARARTAENVREGDAVAVDDFGRVYRAGGPSRG